MADEEKKKSPAEESGSGGFLDVMGRMGEGLIDGLAQSNPIVGLPLQAGFNTTGYQDKQLRRQVSKEALITSQQRNAEWRDEAPLREKQRRNAETQGDEFARGADDREAERKRRRMELAEYADGATVRAMQRDEYLQSAPVRKAQNSATFARANLAEEESDTLYMQGRCTALRDGLKKDLSQNPAFGTMSFAEQDDFCNSPRVQTMIEAKYYLGELQAIGQRDQGAFGRMDRALRRQGWSFIDGKDGIKYLDMGERGQVPATKEAIDLLNKQITVAGMEELNTRSLLADSSALGNPAKRSIALRTRELMQYNGDDASKSLQAVRQVFDAASEEGKGWHMFRQATDDYRNPGVPQTAKQAGIQSCAPFLQKMGFAIEGVDAKNPDIRNATFIDIASRRRLTYDEFSTLCEQNDTLGKRLDGYVENAKMSYITAQNRKIIAGMLGAGSGMQKPGPAPKDMGGMGSDDDQDKYPAGSEVYFRAGKEVMNIAPRMERDLRFKVDTYNKKNPDKTISEKELLFCLGAADEAASRESNGDPELYKRSLVDNVNKTLKPYKISFDQEDDLGFDEKMHNYKIGENRKRSGDNEAEVKGYEEKIREIREKHADEFKPLQQTLDAAKKRASGPRVQVQTEQQRLGNMAMFGSATRAAGQLDSEVKKAEKRISELEEQFGISALQKKIERLQGNNASMQDDSTRRKGRIKDNRRKQEEAEKSDTEYRERTSRMRSLLMGK